MRESTDATYVRTTWRVAGFTTGFRVADSAPQAAGVVDHLADELGLVDGAKTVVVDEQGDDIGFLDRLGTPGRSDVRQFGQSARKLANVWFHDVDRDGRQRHRHCPDDVDRWARAQVVHVCFESKPQARDGGFMKRADLAMICSAT